MTDKPLTPYQEGQQAFLRGEISEDYPEHYLDAERRDWVNGWLNEADSQTDEGYGGGHEA